MIQKLLAYFAHNKYRLMMFVLLAGATIFSVLIWRVRSDFSGTGHYGFLIWNLFLAWIPFIIAYFTYTLTLQRKWIYIVIPIAAFFWLIFFPNAPYILTDFQHLAYTSGDLPVWYDVMMLIWFAFTGLLLGMVSLFLMQEIIRREFGRWVGWAFVAAVTSLTSAGMYMGRFLRWNSWDIFNNPTGMASYTLERVQNPGLQVIGFTGLFAAFFFFLYITLYTFAHLLLERPQIGRDAPLCFQFDAQAVVPPISNRKSNMNKQDIFILYKYNQWANAKILNAAANVTHEQYGRRHPFHMAGCAARWSMHCSPNGSGVIDGKGLLPTIV